MTNASHDIVLENDDALDQLAWAIECSLDKFEPLFARCDSVATRDRLLTKLAERCSVPLATVELPADTQSPYSVIVRQLQGDRPQALNVLGLDTLDHPEIALESMNQMREIFRNTLPFPIVFWLNATTHRHSLRHAPDFESWVKTVSFASGKNAFAERVAAVASRWFQQQSGSQNGSSATTLTAKVSYRDLLKELDAIPAQTCTQLHDRDPVFTANCESIRGLVAWQGRNFTQAIAHYEVACQLWGELGKSDRQATILAELATCYRLQFWRDRNPAMLEIPRIRQQVDRVYPLIDDETLPENIWRHLGDRFYQLFHTLEAWDDQVRLLSQLRAIALVRGSTLDLAKACAFESEVHLHRKQYQSAQQKAQESLELLQNLNFKAAPSTQDVSEPKSKQAIAHFVEPLPRYVLGAVCCADSQFDEARARLEAVLELSDPKIDLKLHLDLLASLETLYRQQKDYWQAFTTKQERGSVEQQFGLRAFVGAAKLRSRPSTLTNEFSGEVAPEIAAFGRHEDLQAILNRLKRRDGKITVLYGFSGVGKSSFIEAGLVPAVWRCPSFNTQDGLPVLVRSYRDWLGELGRRIEDALQLRHLSPHAPLTDAAAIQKQLQINDETHNLLTVLIFDQFEEFFFEYRRKALRNPLFELLGDALNTGLSLRVIFSLRQKYLYYLLGRPQFEDLDILSSKQLYHLGNLTVEAAENAMPQIARQGNFPMQPELVKAVVADLASEYGDVRPIEMQIVGAQLQRENITTLDAYRQRGSKHDLVQRYLDEAIEDCGAEQRQLAERLLFSLTGEKKIRPAKLRTQLEDDLRDLNTPLNGIDLVFDVLVGSGLVLELPETPHPRYQIVHDYVAEFIRQQQQPQMMEVLRQERERREQAEALLVDAEQKNQKASWKLQLSSRLLIASMIGAMGFGAVSAVARRGLERARIGISLEQQANYAAQRFEFDQLETLLIAVRAGRELERTERNGFYASYLPISVLNSTLRNIRERNRLQHQGTVWSASFSPDGSRILTASGDGTARLWDDQGNQLAILEGHQAAVNSARFSPDGNRILTASHDGTARLWDAQGNPLAILEGHHDTVWSARFSPDGSRLLTASGDNTARLWDTQGNLLAILEGHQDTVWSAQFSPDGSRLLTASGDNTARLWDDRGNELAILEGHQNWVTSASFSRDGSRLLTVSDDHTARLWDAQGNSLAVLEGHQAPVNSASFSPDGSRILTASLDNTAQLWDAQGNQLAVLEGHQNTVNSASFSPDGSRILTASGDNTARLWDAQGNSLAVLEGHQAPVNSASFSPDGSRILTALWDSTARLWDAQGNQLAVLEGHQNTVNSASFSPDGSRLLTASHDGTARLWDAQGNPLAILDGHQDWIGSASFSPDGSRILTASLDNTARLWDAQGNQLTVLEGHEDIVRSASFSPDGSRLLTASDDNTARLWNAQGNPLAILEGHQDRVWNARFSPDDSYITTASLDNTVRLWDAQGNPLIEFKEHEAPVFIARFSPDGSRILTASADKTARIWDLQGNTLAILDGHQSILLDADFSPDGSRILTTSADKTARIWDLQGNTLAILDGHEKAVSSAQFSPDGRYVVTASYDETARLWRVESLEEMLERACDWLEDYLMTNPNVTDDDRALCDLPPQNED